MDDKPIPRDTWPILRRTEYVFPVPGVIVVDVETTMDSHLPNKASAFDPANSIVAIGQSRVRPERAPVTTFVGHNIPFDLCHSKVTFLKTKLSNFTVWDTQLAAYLLSGQRLTSPSLDDLCVKYGLPTKDDKVSAYFKAGKGADHVPRKMLLEYLEADIENTGRIAERQMQEAVEKGMLPLIHSQMEALMATTQMTINGMHVNVPYIDATIITLQERVHNCQLELTELAKIHGVPFLDLSKGPQLGKFLFGGRHTEEKRVVVGKYKSGAKMGQDRYSIEQHEYLIPPMVSKIVTAVPTWTPFSVDEHNIAKIAETALRRGVPSIATIIDTVLEHRKCTKLLSTYFLRHKAAIAPDGMLHANFNHTITRTGRLSSSAPSVQNGEDTIKRAYTSRFGADGTMLEMDYNQLEIVMLAHLTQDKQLIADISSGVDIHSALYEQMHHRMPTKEERKPFKRMSFALVYGGGINALAENASVSITEAKEFRDNFYRRYPGVKKWHDQQVEQAKTLPTMVYDGRKTEAGYPSHTLERVSETGRRYTFHQYDSGYGKKGAVGFSKTELVNYPVQGGATGDIVPLVLGKLFRVLSVKEHLADKCLMVCTVHDSVLFDVHNSVLEECITLIKSVMENAPAYYKETFGVDFKQKLSVGVSTGDSWGTLKERIV